MRSLVSSFRRPVERGRLTGRTAVMTFCACTPPLDQVLQLWDYLIAFGVGLNILCVIAQLYVMRDEILVHPS